MKQIKVYDLPSRLFHWSFAILFVVAFFIAQVIDDESALYPYHMLAGIMMSFLVLLRVIWGVIGSKYSKFTAFKLRPTELMGYLISIPSSTARKYLGHNPASSYTAIAMLILTINLAITGILMSKGVYKDFFEEVHELSANGFIVLVIVHIAGVLLHQFKYRDGMLFAMINGKKESLETDKGIRSNHPLIAMIFVGLFVSFGVYLNQNYDSNTQELNLFGTLIELGENEHHENNGHRSSHREHHERNEHEEDDD